LYTDLEEIDEETKMGIDTDTSEKILVKLRRLAIKLELTNHENQENNRSS
jgi:hypothetical protein